MSRERDDSVKIKKMIIPEPKQADSIAGRFILGERAAIYVSNRAKNEDIYAISVFQGQLKEDMGIDIPIGRKHAASGEWNSVEISNNDASLKFKRDFQARDLDWLKQAGKEAYLLKIGENIRIIANASAGLYYGLQTLIQIIRASRGKKIILPGMIIKDRPALQYRGIVYDSRWQITKVDYLKRVIKIAGRYKINTLIFYNENMIKLKKHPELTPRQAYSQSDIRELVRFGKGHHVEIIPYHNSFGHWSSELAKHYPHLSESESGGGPFCPLNEGTYKLLGDIYSELVPLFESPYFFAGCDEVSPIGVCPECRKKAREIGKDGLYIMHVKRLNQMLKEYGKRIVIDGDFFSHHFDRDAMARGSKGQDRSVYKLPEDIIFLDWTAAPDLSGSGIKLFQRSGHEVIVHAFTGCVDRVFPPYRERICNITRYMQAGIKHNVLGEVTAGYECFCRFFEDFWYGYIYSAELAWSGNVKTSLDRYNKNFSHQFFGLKTGELIKVIYLLADCNVFDNSGGAQNPFANWDVFKDMTSPPYSFMEGGEIFKRLKLIPPLAEKALELIERCKDKVSRNNIAVDFLRLAAMRFRHAARQFLLVEEAKRNYRGAWSAQWPMWFPEGFRSARPKEVERKIKKAAELLKEIYEEIRPVKEEVRRLWLWHRKTYHLNDWFVDYYDTQEADLLEKIERLQGFLKMYRERGAGVLPWPDRIEIWQSVEGPGRKKKKFTAWGF